MHLENEKQRERKKIVHFPVGISCCLLCYVLFSVFIDRPVQITAVYLGEKHLKQTHKTLPTRLPVLPQLPFRTFHSWLLGS